MGIGVQENQNNLQIPTEDISRLRTRKHNITRKTKSKNHAITSSMLETPHR
jgi:hypothetical protein